MVKADNQGHGNTKLCGLLLMLLNVLKDEKDKMMTFVEVTIH